MKYAVFNKSTARMLVVGTAQTCADFLGLKDEIAFDQMAQAAKAGRDGKYIVHYIPSDDPVRSPCRDCRSAPDNPRNEVSVSCDRTSCPKHEQWEMRYWALLNRKYGVSR